MIPVFTFEDSLGKISTSDVSVAKVCTAKVFPPLEGATSQILTGEVVSHVHCSLAEGCGKV
jgi:hypothetical protein